MIERERVVSGLNAACPARRSLALSREDAPALHLREWGVANPACLFIHGFGDNGHIWDEFVSRVKVPCRMVALDLRGHGDSGWDITGRYGIDMHVADAVYAVSALGLEQAVIIGHSMGGEVALRVAAACSDCVRGLILVDFGPHLNPEGTRQVKSEFQTAHRQYGEPLDYVRWLVDRRPLAQQELLYHVACCALRPLVSGVYELKADPALAREDAVLQDAKKESELWTLLARIGCPSLVVRGAGSAVLSLAVAERMMHVLPNGRLASIRLAGHAVMLDNPAGFAQAVLPFLESVLAAIPQRPHA
jgi:pimeloyl-ACP methyl ester carboxylesterase